MNDIESIIIAGSHCLGCGVDQIYGKPLDSKLIENTIQLPIVSYYLEMEQSFGLYAPFFSDFSDYSDIACAVYRSHEGYSPACGIKEAIRKIPYNFYDNRIENPGLVATDALSSVNRVVGQLSANSIKEMRHDFYSGSYMGSELDREPLHFTREGVPCITDIDIDTFHDGIVSSNTEDIEHIIVSVGLVYLIQNIVTFCYSVKRKYQKTARLNFTDGNFYSSWI